MTTFTFWFDCLFAVLWTFKIQIQ